jgi:Fe-Mn family superoxide dismutase
MESQNYYQFKKLPYSYDALEPFIDSLTMQTHYEKHHQGYYNNFVKTMKDNNFENKPILDIFKNMSSYPEQLKNFGGGYWNHEFFWETMSPEINQKPDNELLKAIEKDFGSFENFEAEFTKKATSLFGSGWTWLIVTSDKKLKLVNTANQDNPYMNTVKENGIPILGIDVWEHAYYLKYKNLRADYISNFLKIINWKVVSERYKNAIN